MKLANVGSPFDDVLMLVDSFHDVVCHVGVRCCGRTAVQPKDLRHVLKREEGLDVLLHVLHALDLARHQVVLHMIAAYTPCAISLTGAQELVFVDLVYREVIQGVSLDQHVLVLNLIHGAVCLARQIADFLVHEVLHSQF